MRKHTRTRPVFLSICLCLIVLWRAACGGPSSTTGATPASPDKQILRFPLLAADFTSLDPAVSAASADSLALGLLFSGLVQAKSDNSVALDLASSYQVSSDGLSYTFKLRPNLTFSNGRPLTASDVAYSINRALLPATASPTASFLASIKDFVPMVTGKIPTLIGDSLIVQGPQTFTIVLGAPAAYFLLELAGNNSHVVNKDLIDKYGAAWTDHLTEGAGAGAFQVGSYSHSQGLVLVPNPHYYGTKARLQKLEFLPIGNPATVYKEYLAHQVDFTNVPIDDLDSAKSRKDYQQAPALAIILLQMNYLAKPFDNTQIRQAFDLAIDKDILANNVLHGAYKPTNHIIPQGMPGYNPNLTGPAGVKATAGDKTKAKQLLQAGLQAEGYSSASALPDLTLVIPNDDQTVQNLAQAIVQQWQTVLGVGVQLKPESTSTFLSQDAPATIGHSGPLQMWFLGYGYLADPFFWLNSFFGPGASFNFANYGTTGEQQAIQQQLAAAVVNTNMQQRTQQYNDAEQKIVNDVGWLPLTQAENVALINPKVQNLSVNGPTMTWSDVFIAA